MPPNGGHTRPVAPSPMAWPNSEQRGEPGPAPGAVGAFDVTPFIGPGLMRVGGCGHAAAPC